jgi:hypothetical protein
VNGDSKLDLATGAWWDNTRIFINDGNGLPTSSSWNSQWTSVIEKIVFGDVGPHLTEIIYTKIYSPSGNKKLYYLPHQPIQDIVSITLDGIKLESSEYTFSREHGWFTLYAVPTNTVEVEYKYSYSLDMIVSNWDSNVGNFLYYNQLFMENLECSGDLNFNDVIPGSVVYGTIGVQNVGIAESELDWEIDSYPDWGTWKFSPDSGLDITPENGEIIIDVEIITPEIAQTEFIGEVRIVNSNNRYDFCCISTVVVTPIIQQINIPNVLVGNQKNVLI